MTWSPPQPTREPRKIKTSQGKTLYYVIRADQNAWDFFAGETDVIPTDPGSREVVVHLQLVRFMSAVRSHSEYSPRDWRGRGYMSALLREAARVFPCDLYSSTERARGLMDDRRNQDSDDLWMRLAEKHVAEPVVTPDGHPRFVIRKRGQSGA
jgi:hypothetical protein